MHSFPRASFGYLLVTLFVACLPFENSILQNTGLGFFGSSLSLIPLCMMLAFFPQWAKDKLFWLMIFLAVFCSLVGLLIHIEFANNALTRGPRFFIIWVTFLACLFWFRTWHASFTSFHAYLLLAILTVSILMEMFMHDFLIGASILHANQSGNMRPRGFTLESSHFGYQIVLGFLFCGVTLRRGIGFLIVAVAAAFFSGSKGALLSLVLSIFLAYVWTSKGKIAKIAIIVILVPVVVLVFNTFLLERFQVDLDDYTSLSTRLTLFVLAVQSFIANPLGYGMTGYAAIFPANGPAALDFMQSIGFSGIALREVADFFNPNETKNIGLKSFILEMAIIYGIAGLYLVLRNLRSAVAYFKVKGSVLGLSLVFFLIISNLFFVSPVAIYLTPMVIGVILGRIRSDGIVTKDVQ